MPHNADTFNLAYDLELLVESILWSNVVEPANKDGLEGVPNGVPVVVWLPYIASKLIKIDT